MGDCPPERSSWGDSQPGIVPRLSPGCPPRIVPNCPPAVPHNVPRDGVAMRATSPRADSANYWHDAEPLTDDECATGKRGIAGARAALDAAKAPRA